ncbi:MAG TPA: M28 family peptidase [Bacteroidia bacterium]|nr:M28 family peptidase [Bacteroidia bacterium]
MRSLQLIKKKHPGKHIFLTGFVFILFFVTGTAEAQDSVYTRSVINTLTGKKLYGRGYYLNGDGLAAQYLSKEFKAIGLEPVNGNYLQPFTFPVNSFPGKVSLKIGDKTLIPGKDFIVSPGCPAISGKFKIKKAQWPYAAFLKSDLSNDFILIDKSTADSSGREQLDKMIHNPPLLRGLLIVEPQKLTWSVSQTVNDLAIVNVLQDSFPADAGQLEIKVQSSLNEQHHTQNIIGIVPGTVNPDSFIVFTAHYDHLGQMGKDALFPGANDNASGVSMVLNLARHYAAQANRTGKTMVFILFAGEEAGLVGSKYFVEHPLIPLDKIRFLINLDLLGTGDDGMMVVNGDVYKEEFQMLESINETGHLLKEIGKRGKAKNSDHYYFSEKGVPAFFFYTTGGSKAYHDIYDTADKLSLTGYSGVFKLITSFVDEVGK